MPKITYEELMTELMKYDRTHLKLTAEQEKVLIDCREKYDIPYTKIADVFTKKYGRKYDRKTLEDKYKRLKQAREIDFKT